MILLRDAVPLAPIKNLNLPLCQTLEHNDTFMEDSDSPMNANRKLFDSITPLEKKHSTSSNSTCLGTLALMILAVPSVLQFPVVQSTISGLHTKTKNWMAKTRRLQIGSNPCKQ